MAKKRQSTGQTIGGILAGFDQQVWRTTPPAQELVAKGKRLAPVPAEGGGTLTVGFADEADAPAGDGAEPATLRLDAPGAHAVVDLAHGGRLASLVVDGRELPRDRGGRPHRLGLVPDGAVCRPGARRAVHLPR